MKIWISADSDWETRTDRIAYELDAISAEFQPRDYGASIIEVNMILMCRSPVHAFRQRHRLEKGRCAYWLDIMLDHGTMLAADMQERMAYVVDQVHAQLSAKLAKRRFDDFDAARFFADLERELRRVREGYDGHGSGPWKY